MADETTILRVKSTSSVSSLASAISYAVYDGKDITLRAIGPAAVSQAVKAVAAARGVRRSARAGLVSSARVCYCGDAGRAGYRHHTESRRTLNTESRRTLNDNMGTFNTGASWTETFADPFNHVLAGYTAVGNHYFRVPYISRIVDNLYQGGCTTGLVLPPEIKHVFSLYPWERYEVHHNIKTEAYFYFYDDMSKMSEQTIELVEAISDMVAATHQEGVLIHCQAGLNRSSLIMGRSLMKIYPMDADEAIAIIRSERSEACLCNTEFEKYLQAI